MILALILAASAPAAAPDFDPIRFFAGRTRGEGRMKVILRAGRPIRVQGHGRVEPDGTLVLDQAVTTGDNPPKARQWRLRAVAPGRYQGTLTDARGPVSAEATGNRLRVTFKSTDGFDIEQAIVLAPDARSAHNHLVARRFGIVVATLDEEIVKLD